MKWGWVLVIFLAAWLIWLVNDRVDTQEQRITQLECALAQAHATVESLEMELDRCLEEQGRNNGQVD